MQYRHDVFISYRRGEVWTAWTREHFKHLLEVYLRQELGTDPDIFVDERIEEGADWPNELGEHLAMSRVMVAVFSGDYFSSQWCLHELDLMIGRSMMAAPTCRLIIPVIVHDGELIPDEVDRKLAAKFQAFRVAYIRRESDLYQQFSVAMKELAPRIKAAIQSAPPYENGWLTEAKKRFDDVFKNNKIGKSVPVSNFDPKPLPILRVVPRLVV